jgi:hypothetical protein
MTAKAWYWTGLGVLALSMASSGTGRLWMEKVSGMTDQLRAKALPYVAMTEIALGRTQAGIDHMESARARVEEQAARVAAAQARIDANSARLEALSAGRKFRRMNVFADYSDMSGSVIEVPGVRISEHKIVVQGPTGMVVCPRVRMKTPLVAAPAPPVSIMQDPI